MQKTILGIFVTSLALYLLGFLYWGISTMPYSSLKQTTDVVQTQALLRQAFPESGTYLIPGPQEDAEKLKALHQSGPVGLFHVQLEASNPTDPAGLIQGFVLDLLVVALMAGLFNVCKAREFRDFAWISMMVGVVGIVMFDGGKIVWWRESVGWNVWQMIYNFSALVLVGHLLGIFMKEKPAETT